MILSLGIKSQTQNKCPEMQNYCAWEAAPHNAHVLTGSREAGSAPAKDLSDSSQKHLVVSLQYRVSGTSTVLLQERTANLHSEANEDLISSFFSLLRVKLLTPC